MLLKLRIDSGPRADTTFTLVPGANLRVGRMSDAAVSLPDDPFISGFHLELVFDGQSCILRDLNSRNGTLLNGSSISEALLRTGDKFTAGQTEFILIAEPDQSPAPRGPQTSPLDEAGKSTLLRQMRGNLQPLYAVLDAARDPRILATLIQSKSDYLPLFDDGMTPELRHFAPYLVALPPGSTTMETLIDIGWGQNWGLFLTSAASGLELHRVLRRLLIAYLPDRSQVFLRFYDPRVFETLFAEPSEQQCAAFFSHVNSYLMNGELQQSATGFIRAGLGLDRVDIQLCEHSKITRTSVTVTRCAGSHSGEVTLSTGQVNRLQTQEHVARMDHLMQVVRHEHPQQGSPDEEKELRDLVLYGCKKTHRYGIHTDKDVADYLSLMIELGRDFDQDAHLPWASTLLRQRMPPGGKLSRLKERAYLERSSKNIEHGVLP